jgi:hypothetical protein
MASASTLAMVSYGGSSERVRARDTHRLLLRPTRRSWLSPREIADIDVSEFHVAAAAGMELQRDGPVERFRPGIREVDHRDAVQARDIAVPFDLQQVLVPFPPTDDGLVFRGGPYNPFPFITVDATRVLVDGAIHLELEPLRHVGRTGLEVGVEEDPAVAVSLAPELEPQVEVHVVADGLQVAVLLGDRRSMDDAILDSPFLLAHLGPAGQVAFIE